MADKRVIKVETLDRLAKGFQESRGITDKLSLDEMATLAAEPSIETQQKTIDITSNGTTEITPDEGYALSKVTANVNVAGEDRMTAFCKGEPFEITAEDLEGATELREYMFYYSSLSKITTPNEKLTNIGVYACHGCYNLTEAILGDAVTSISGGAFSYCEKLSLLVLGRNVSKLFSNITQYSGSSTNKLTIKVLSTTPPSIDYDSISTTNLNKILVKYGYGEVYKNATNWANLTDYIEEGVE